MFLFEDMIGRFNVTKPFHGLLQEVTSENGSQFHNLKKGNQFPQ